MNSDTLSGWEVPRKLRPYHTMELSMNKIHKQFRFYTNEIVHRSTSFINKAFFPERALNYDRIFTEIYENGVWNNKDESIPLSGPGSTRESSKNIARLLEEFVYNNDIKSVVDLGCGDLTYMRHTKFFNDNEIQYTGIDIVDSVLDMHSKNFKNKSFYKKDITKDPLPIAELVIIKDVIFHLHIDSVIRLFENIRDKYQYIAITSCLNKRNSDVFDQWHFSERNLNISPFNICSNHLHEIRAKKSVFYIYKHDSFYQ